MSIANFYIGGTYVLRSGSDENPRYKEARILCADPDDGACLYVEVASENDADANTTACVEQSQLGFVLAKDVLNELLEVIDSHVPDDVATHLYSLLQISSQVRIISKVHKSPGYARYGYLRG